MNTFERQLKQRIEKEVADLATITPGMVIDVHVRGRRKGLLHVGRTYDFYDLASLTKILFTASASMHYFSDDPRELNLPVRIVLPWWKAQTTPVDLLTHTAGLDWWRPYYRTLKGPLNPQKRWDQLKRKLTHVKPTLRIKKATYSDLDLWMMGAFLEAAKERSLLQMWEEVAERLKLKNVFFHPGNRPRYARSRYAATESCHWRRKILHGEVHDENAWALGGVAPHAGLFGSIEAVSDWGLKLRGAVLRESKLFGDPKVVQTFTQRRVKSAIGDWGLGFMLPTRGRASCGKYFSARSFGHTGFTGTSFWFDPRHDVQVVILSNRVHPTRNNNQFALLRPQVHDWICQLL